VRRDLEPAKRPLLRAVEVAGAREEDREVVAPEGEPVGARRGRLEAREEAVTLGARADPLRQREDLDDRARQLSMVAVRAPEGLAVVAEPAVVGDLGRIVGRVGLEPPRHLAREDDHLEPVEELGVIGGADERGLRREEGPDDDVPLVGLEDRPVDLHRDPPIAAHV
jgi:hypothetical protein